MEEQVPNSKEKYIYESHSYDMKWYRHVICFSIGFIGLQLLAFLIEIIVLAIFTGKGINLVDCLAQVNLYTAYLTDGTTVFDESMVNSYFLYMVIVQVGAYILTTIFVLVSLVPNHIKDVFKGFKEKDSWIHGLFYGLLLITGQSVISIIINWCTGGSSTSNSNQSTIELLTQKHYLLMFICTVFCAPLVEEITYRLGLFGLINKKNKYLALIVSAVIFALIHFDFEATGSDLVNEFINMPYYLYSGIILGLCYSRSGRLSDSIICHATNNLVSMLGVLIAMIPQ